MSQVHVALVRVASSSTNGLVVPVAHTALVDEPEAITSSASTQETTLEVTRDMGSLTRLIWRVAVFGDEAVYAAFGATGLTAGPTTGYLCPPNGVYEFGAGAVGDVCGIINA